MRPDTLERVMRAVGDLGYAPNQIARGLKTGFVPTIGLIVPSVANPFWGAFARWAEHAAMARNCQVMLCNSERDAEREQRCAESMLSRGIRGVILGSSPLSMQHIVGLTARGLQVVAFDRHVIKDEDGLELDSVRVDNVLGARLAVQHLIQLGHRSIGFISGPILSASRMDRLNGYREALSVAGIEPDPALIWAEDVHPTVGSEEGPEIGRAAALAMLRRVERPTALFAINDLTAVGIYGGARELGLRVPQDVSIVGFDDISLCRVMNPAVTTVRQPLEELMRAAVEMLMSRLSGSNREPPMRLTVEPELIVRGSTGPRG